MRNIEYGEVEATEVIDGSNTVIYKVKLEGINFVKSVIKTTEDAHGNKTVIQKVTLLVQKETWTSAEDGIDNEGSNVTEASHGEFKGRYN